MATGRRKKIVSSVAGLLVVGGAVYSVLFLDWRRQPPPEEELVRPLKTVVVTGAGSERQYKYLGIVEAANEAALSFDVSGTLISLDVQKGDRVEKGQLLASLDARDFENAVAAAKADAEKARIDLERLRPAAETGAVQMQQLTAAEALAATTAARLKIQEKALADTQLKASFDGVIADVLVENFESITAKQSIMVLQATDYVDVTVDVPESRVAEVDPKRARDREWTSTFTMSLDYFPDRTFAVTPKEFKTQADRLTLSYKVTFTMPRPEDVTLLPGMPATVTETKPVEAGAADGFLLPADAVPVDTMGRYFVWSLTGGEGGVFAVQRRQVEVGEMLGDSIVVRKGVFKGDRIAAAGVHVLKEGQRVRLLENGGATQ
ncbi:MAG: efflux RND transporter periplasmic adaptor subunit [Phycisphaerales bacterium]|nr:MAG: efflux RND transporter periplasmic adaptor subunit [Phycisphaerales bacterium]